MEMRIARRQALWMLVMGAAATGLGFSQSPRHWSLALVTNSDGNDITVIDLERLAPAGNWQGGVAHTSFCYVCGLTPKHRWPRSRT